MELTITKEKVLEAASKCSTAKATLSVLFPEVFEKKQEFKLGDWVVWLSNPNNYVHRIGDTECNGGGMDTNPKYYTGCGADCYRLATEEEIKTHLIKEAEKRGFAIGVNIQTLDGEIRALLGMDLIYNLQKDMLYATTGYEFIIYQKGKWATILPTTKKVTLKEVAEKFGVDKIEVVD